MEKPLKIPGLWVALLAVVLGLCLLPGSARAQASRCPETLNQEATVGFKLDLPEVRFSHEQSRDRLAMMEARMRKTVRGAGWRTSGFTHAEARFSLRISVSYLPMGNVKCAYLGRVEGQWGFQTLDVFVAKEIAGGSCAYQVTLAHERQHVAIFQDGLKRFAADLETALKEATKQQERRIVRDINDATAYYKTNIMAAVQAVLDRYESYTRTENAKLDTPDNYKAEQAKCPSWF